MREKGVDETSKGSWAGGLPPRGTEARFESQVPEGNSVPESGQAPGAPASGSGSTLDIVFIVKQDGTILYLNRTLQGAPESAPGSSIFTYTNEEYHGALREALEKVFSTGEAHGYECMGVEPFKDGAWFQCRVAPNRREGKVVSATIIARDMTTWKRAEEGLRQERDQLKNEFDSVKDELERLRAQVPDEPADDGGLDRFRAIIDQAGEAIFITDPETGRFVDVNETACRWLGQRREKLLTLGINDLDLDFPLESPNGVPEHVTNTRNSHRPRIFRGGSHRRRNGTSFPVEVAIAKRQFGGRQYMLVVARDIKERSKTTDALREVEDRFRSLFELSRDAIYLSARDGSVAEVNDAAVDLFGYTRAEFLVLEARKLYLKPEDVRTFQRGVDQSGSVRNMEVGLRKKGGSTFTGLLSATLRHDGEGNILGYQCMIRPETENGKTESQEPEPVAAATLDQPPQARKDGVLVVDGDKRVLAEVREVLERAGISVVTARTSAAGIEVFRAQEADVGVVLLGEGDKETETAAAVKQLEAIDPEVRVVVMSDATVHSDEKIAQDLGDIDIVRKPIHPLALVQHVREALAARQSH
jgi:PAS domain S-box-containing protein